MREAVVEAEAENQPVLVPVQVLVPLFRALLPGQTPGDYLRPPAAADVIPGLVAGQGAGDGDDDHPVDVEVLEVCRHSGEDHNGFTFDEGDQQNGEVAVLLYERLKCHGFMVS